MAPGLLLQNADERRWSSLSEKSTTSQSENGQTGTRIRSRAPIAIIGMGSKFGGTATDPQRLWDMVASGENAWSPIPKDRFDVESFYHADKDRPGRNHARGGHFITEDLGLFDAGFFNISADGASAMDPQLRLLLESVTEAFEDAGIPLEKVAGSETSVYTGVYGKDYHELQTRDPDALPASFLTGNGTAMLSNRISHFYDLQGASMTIDTGCSSGLVALHQACQSLLSDESEMSVVGATTAILNPDLYIAMSALSMVGADGKCYAWDARAEGYGRGEGVAALVLKRLDAAIRDGDHVHAVIRETGLNQDGATKTITSPSIEAQVKLIEKCYHRAGLNMAETGYVEAHMTGTPTGDLAEATAIARTFGKARKMGDPIHVGSVKVNVGHTESVSGLAGIIKTVFAMENRVIPPNINYETPNPKIPLKEWNLTVPTALIPWPKDKALRASINNFGYGGANSHVILEAAPASSATIPAGSSESVQSRIFLFSAKDQVAIKGMISKLTIYAKNLLDDSTLGGIAYTLAERRSRFPWIAAVRASNRAELVQALSEKSLKGSHITKKPRLGFVLNGQGAQWHAMGRELIAEYPVFGSAVNEADKILKAYGADWSLLEELMREKETTKVSQMHLSQPVTVALQLCLLKLLDSWDIRPAALSSHSSGEIAAAYAVGALTFAEALGAAFYRGQIPSRNKELSSLAGGMLAAGISREKANPYIEATKTGRAVVACINSPDSVTISGDSPAIDEIEARLTAEGIFARRLKVPLAYHSHHMQLLAKEYTDRLRETIAIKPDSQWTSKYRYASPVTGEIITAAKALGPEYFVHNLTNPVLFSESFEKMCYDEGGKAQVDVIVEIGAHGTLAGPIRQILKGREIPYVSTLARNVNAVHTMQNMAVELLNHGYDISLAAINSPSGDEQPFVRDLPKYAWNHSTRYWSEPRINKEIRQKKFAPHELLGSLLPGDNGLSPTWRNFLRLSEISWLIDHQIQGYVVLPGAGYISMAIEATKHLHSLEKAITGFQLRDIEVLNALIVPDTTIGVETQLNMRPTTDGWYEYRVTSLNSSNTWIVNCSGFIRAETTPAKEADLAFPTNEFFHPGVKPVNIDPESLWADLRKMSMYHGAVFRPITGIKSARDKSITDITIKDVVSEAHDYTIHPTTLDGIFIAAYNGLPKSIRDAYTVVPRKFRGITIRTNLSRKGGEDIQCFSQVHHASTKGFDSTIKVVNAGQESGITLQVDNFFAQAIPREADEGVEKPGIISRLKWEADLTSTIPAAFKESLIINKDGKPADFERKVQRVAFSYINDALKELENSLASLSSKHAAFFTWMKNVVVLANSGKLGPRSNTWARASEGKNRLLADEIYASGIPSARLVVRIGQQLSKILRGEADAAEVANADDLLNQYYVGHPKLESRSFQQLSKIVQQLAIIHPGANVLELGASTGAATKIVLEAFGAGYSSDGSRLTLGHYDFTNKTSDCFDTVMQKLAPWSDLMSTKLLDIEKDPREQSFALASYDFIVASQTLYKSSSLRTALDNVHKLLKPGGKLLMIETTRDQLDHKLVFGMLPSLEVAKKSGQSISIQEWDQHLRDSGFSGVQVSVDDTEDLQFQSFSVMMASKVTSGGSFPSTVSILHAGQAPPEQWTKQLSSAIKASVGASLKVESLDSVETSDAAAYILTPELQAPFVSDLDKPSFEHLKRFLGSAQNIMWLSSGGLVDVEEPLIGATNGLLRVLRQEDAFKRCVHLDFAKPSDGNPWTSDKIDHIINIFTRVFDNTFTPVDQDWEYSIKDSLVFVPRCYPKIETHSGSELTELNFKQDATYLVIGGMGGIGQNIASWMMEKGVKNLLITSRNAGSSSSATDTRAMARADGCNIQIQSCDVSNENDFVNLLANVATTMPPIRGVVNAAMVLKNSVLDNMSYETWQSGIKVKIASSFNVHKHLTDIDFFVQLSSAIGIPGHPSQAHYAAGNTFQDALARHRAGRGLPAITLNLTAIEGVGWMAQQGEAEQEVVKRIQKVGLSSAGIDMVMDLVEDSIREPLRKSAADSQVIVGLSSYDAIPEGAVTKGDRRFGTLRLATIRAGAENAAAASSGAKDSLAELMRAAADGNISKDDAIELVIDAVTGKIAAIFNIEQSEIDPIRSLSSYGVDSLVAVELRNWLASSLKAKVSIFDILQSPSFVEFSALLASKSEMLIGLA